MRDGEAGATDPFQLLQDARVQVLVHVPVLEGVVGGFLGGVGGGVEVLELGGEAHADFEGVGHGVWEDLRVFGELHSVCGYSSVFGPECRVGEVKKDLELSSKYYITPFLGAVSYPRPQLSVVAG